MKMIVNAKKRKDTARAKICVDKNASDIPYLPQRHRAPLPLQPNP